MNSPNSLWARRQLLKYLVISKLKLGKKDLLLGYVWWVLEPLLLMGVYVMLISVILQRGEPDYALFILCGLVPFRGLSVTVGQSVMSVSGKFSIISQINFPRIFLPLSDVITNHIKLFVGLLVIIAVATLYGIWPSIYTTTILIPLILQLIMASGIAFILAITGVFIRDIRNLSQFIIRIWLYGSPVLYSMDRIPDDWQYLLWFNPMTPIILMYRDIFMYGGLPQERYMLIATAEAALLFGIGYLFFTRYESRILKSGSSAESVGR